MMQYIVQWMMATYFELTSLARHLYCLFSEVGGQVKCEDNGERILYVDGQELSIVKLVS